MLEEISLKIKKQNKKTKKREKCRRGDRFQISRPKKVNKA
jgi:hypothetical protein